MQNLSGSVVRELLKLTQQPNMISFAGGMPPRDSFPAQEMAELAQEIISTYKDRVLQYGTTEGMTELRQILAEWIRCKGISVPMEQVLVVSGAQQGIDLAAKALLNPGDYVLTVNPTYLTAIQVFKTYEARFATVDEDAEGPIISEIEAHIERFHPKIFYLIPTFGNPEGLTITLARRKQIADLLSKHEIILVEDDPYRELRYAGEPLPAIFSLDKSGQTIYLGSFSKIISPGLRVGYAVASDDVMRKLVIGKQGTDVHTSNLSQALVYEYIKRGMLEPHIEAVKPMYRAKLAAMLGALEMHFPRQVKFSRPEGGLFIWAVLPEGADCKEIMKPAIDRRVAFVPGDSFFAGEHPPINCMRLNYSNASVEQIQAGIKILGEVVTEYLKSKKLI
jgi:2-aminoadipate transaminase